MKLSLGQLSHLVAVAHLGSFSRAAKELNLTQPALSRSVSAVEQQFGIRIFERSRSAVIPTPVGRELIAEGQRLIDQARTLEQNLVLWGEGRGGSVSFGVGPLVASIALPEVLVRLARDTPHIHVEAHTNSMIGLLEMLERGDIDFLFTTRRQVAHHLQLSSVRIGSLTNSLFVRSGHPLAMLSPVSISEVLAYPIARGGISKFGHYGEFGKFLTEEPSIICDNYSILHEVMINSDVIWITSDRLIEDDIKSGKAVALACPDFQAVKTEIVMLWLTGRSLSPAARRIGNMIAAALNRSKSYKPL